MTDADLRVDLNKEWLETNGIGGYASSTVAGLNTRRYHGLLVAATEPPVGRAVLLSKLEETLVVGSERFELGANKWASGAVRPEGFRYLVAFREDPYPEWTYAAGGVEVVRRLYMVQGENTVVVHYELHGAKCELEVRPLVAFRDFHALTHANGTLNAEVKVEGRVASIQPYPDLPRLYFAHDAEAVERSGSWYYGFDYARERERGLEAVEDLYQPLVLRFRGKRGVVIASTEKRRSGAGPVETRNRADQFIVKRGEFHSIIAGYHWFGDWGRDAMIALPGLTLVRGRFDVAKSVLSAFAGCVSEGMLPSRFPDHGEQPEYNTVDAALWFFEAVRWYLEFTRDLAFVEKMMPVMRRIVEWYECGTRFGIRADADGLVKTEAGQLTWMDTAATPRRGKAVEVQALWYNALRILIELGAKDLAEMAERAKANFNAKFWNEAAGCLFDVIEEEDTSIRPNQVIALSLKYSMVSQERAERILQVVERKLVTPVGLRSLSPGDAKYRGRYVGGPAERDAAYHQGTVWPWLIGPYVSACLKVRGEAGFAFRDAGLGLAPEIYDGDAPHLARGCIAQAWSLGELLRAQWELRRASST
ncbi:MAG TPA: amylo-alpha-1,6-glucosidase [Bryobacteraceae bacterium]|nr:amylo-alpha-1,6-glucosidase [Bryobacteraceae bacterium]